MKLATLSHGGRPALGVVEGDTVLDLTAGRVGAPASVQDFLALPEHDRAETLRAARKAPRLSLDAVRLHAPIPAPRLILCTGLNYAAHAREMGKAIPKAPAIFAKSPGAVAGPYDPVAHPGFSDSLDYEGELALVIGRAARAVSADEAAAVIAGYMVLNDFSLREHLRVEALVLAKSADGFAPCGPWLTLRDAAPKPDAMQLRTFVNGDLRQQACAEDMIFDPFALIEIVTRFITLQPGDILSTGSPPGSGAGFAPPRFLKPNDRVRVEIDGLGAIENVINPAQSPSRKETAHVFDEQGS